MVVKSVIMLLVFFIPMSLIIFSPISHPFWIFTLYILSGLGMAGIGMGIMHDAIHGSFSRFKWLNWLMSNTINLIGSDREMWRLQHNVLHHTFTNIEDHDDDINAPFFLRFSPNAPKNKLHRYQHWYAWIFYGMMTMSWVSYKDYKNLVRFRKLGLVEKGKSYYRNLFNITACKVIFLSAVLVVPLIFSSASGLTIVLAFLTMQFVTGISISLVFQAAHVMPGNEFPVPNQDGEVDNDRMAHQLVTTSNFAQKSRFLFWSLGGLTNQIEHHLFPHISHIHYKKIAPIVKQTAIEYGLPYNTTGSFFATIKSHFKMLKVLGSIEVSPLNQTSH
jgi:linoleoyl-CoA desaturase